MPAANTLESDPTRARDRSTHWAPRLSELDQPRRAIPRHQRHLLTGDRNADPATLVPLTPIALPHKRIAGS